jgi:peptidoglycan/xylan/chitin deacetylase (PgdA/CDA1 family)
LTRDTSHGRNGRGARGVGRRVAFVGAAILIGALVAIVASPAAAEGLESCDRARAPGIGSDPYVVAAGIAESFETAGIVFVATGTDFPDAITVGPVTGLHSAPLLLTRPGSLPAVTRRALGRLNPDRIIVLGGTSAVGIDVEDELRARFSDVVRVAGADRHATAAAISRWQFPDASAVDTVYLASGATYFDSLVAGTRAMHDYAPILLVGKNRIPGSTAEELTRLEPSRILVVSTAAVVTDDAVAQLATYALSVERLDLPDRFSTPLGGARGAVAAAVAHHAPAVCGPPARPAAAPAGDRALECPAGRVALTYDDGPRPERTDAVVAALKRAAVRATFFVVGDRVASSPETLRSVHEHGHVVANHTWGHVNLRELDDAEIAASVADTDELIRSLGIPMLRLVRPPFGATDERVRRALSDAGFGQIKWNLNPKDWSGRSVSEVHEFVVANARDGSIVTLHDGTANYAETAAATGQIVASLRDRGFCFGVLNENGDVVP